MPEEMTIDMDLRQVRGFRTTARLMERAGLDTRKPLKTFNAAHQLVTKRQFDEGGRDGNRWRPLAESTLQRRLRSELSITGSRSALSPQGSVTILKITGELQRSIGGKVEKKGRHYTAVTTSSSDIAPYHQKAKDLRRRRKLIVYTDQDVKAASQLLATEQTEAIKRAVKKRGGLR